MDYYVCDCCIRVSALLNFGYCVLTKLLCCHLRYGHSIKRNIAFIEIIDADRYVCMIQESVLDRRD